MQKRNKVRKARKIKFLRNAGASVLAILIAVALVIGLVPNSALAASTTDLDTSTKYKESLGDNASTEYAGRIWTDKSVYDEDKTFEMFGGKTATIKLGVDGNGQEVDEDFLVAYSALATSESIEGQTQAPVDVVLIIDVSGSMSNNDSDMDNNKSRIYNTVQAANNAIDELMALNPYTRVAVVAFSSNAQVLLPLDRYTKTTEIEREWISTGRWSGYWQETEVEVPYFTLNRETGSNNYADLYTNAINSDNDTITDTTDVEGGTNIQMGLYEGMQVLAEEESTTVEIDGATVQRIPSVILLSDGSPTYSSNSQSWWAPEDNHNDGPGSRAYAGNGMKAILVGSYMKDAIDRNYGVGGTAFKTTVYTVGMGITGLSDSEKNLAYMTLDPGTYWDDTDVTNSMKTAIKEYWDKYTARNNTGTLNINVGRVSGQSYYDKNYSLTHPTTGYDVDPKTGYDYVDIYYGADKATDVTDVFEQIVSNISIAAPQVPTELKGADPVMDGYITYTDPIGEYMEVKDVKSILYAGTEFTAKTVKKDGNVTTYTFSGTVESPVYGNQEIKDIIITVEEDANGNETLIVKIPASVIPLRVNEVELNADGSVKTHTNNGAYPARVIYSVGLQDGIKKTADSGVEYIDTSLLSEEYLDENTENGEVKFYSNLFTNTNDKVNGSTVGDTTVEFEPSHTNPFYYILKDMPIYKDAQFKDQVKASEGLDDDTIYYYRDEYYHGTSTEVDAIERTGAQLKATEIKTGVDGNLYRAAGSPRLNRMLRFEGTKSKNATETAEDFYAPTFQLKEGSTDPYDGKLVVYLGNNGVLSLSAGGNLQISKEVNAGMGLTAPDKAFEFKLDLNGDKVDNGTYKYVIIDQNNKQVSTGTVSKANPTITLKDGQTATIYSLPPGTTYTVTEADVAGFTTEAEGATGTIEAGKTNKAEFTNTYNVDEVQFPTNGTLAGTKKLDGRDWTADDSFTFFITPYNNAPLPVDYDADKGVVASKPDAADGATATFDFGTIEFTAPGTYRYTIVEKEPENDEYLPGMSYSRALYRLVVEVVDNGEGKLFVDDYEIQKLYEDDATQLFTYVNDEIKMNEGQEGPDNIVFTNTYSAEGVTRVPVALKDYTDNSGMNPLVSGMFEFKLEAVGIVTDLNDVDDTEDDVVELTKDIPMPAGTENGVCITTNEGQNVTFPGVTFTQADLKGEESVRFRYKMSEVTPANKVNGMTYDSSVYTIDVVVSIDHTANVLNVNAIYPDDTRIVTFRNEYTPNPVTASIKGTKTLVGRDMKAGETFTFGIDGGNAATGNAVRDQIVKNVLDRTVSVTGGKDGKAVDFAFDDIEFTKAGTYVFAISETQGSAPSVGYDDNVVYVTVVIDDANKDGNLDVASITYSNGADAAEFTNTYTTEFEGTPISLNGTKNLTGKSLLAGEFYFNVVEYKNGEKVSEDLVSNAADTEADAQGRYSGTIELLENKTYSEVGTYEYYITEQVPAQPVKGTTYDDSEYKFTVVVEDKDTEGNEEVGKLTVTSTKLEIKENEKWVVANNGVVFTNEYEPESKAAAVPVMKKVIAGSRSAALAAGDFEFELAVKEANPTDGIVLPADNKASNDANGNIEFDKIIFKKAGTYTVKVTEIEPTDTKIAGIEYSTDEFEVTYNVVDDRNGNLTVTVVETTGNTFVNKYTASPAEVNVQISKLFTGRDNDEWLPTDKFDFEVVILDPATQQAVEDGMIEFPTDSDGTISTKTIEAADQTVTGTIKINVPGTYKIRVHEINGGIAGVTYDSTPRDITIVATDDSENAKINTEVSINGTESTAVEVDGKDVHKLVFENVYDADSTELSGHDKLWVKKNFTGREGDKWLDDDKFEFVLAAKGEVTEKAVADGIIELPDTKLTVSNANKAHAHFGNIVFHEEGTYTFTVTEQQGTIKGVTYDIEPRTIIVEVKDNDNGELVAELAAGSDELVFDNTYGTSEYKLNGKQNLEVEKVVAGRDWFPDDEFTFTLEAADDATKEAITNNVVTLPTDTEITVDASDEDHKVNFGDITFNKVGTYQFVIKEKSGDIDVSYDTHQVVVTVVVFDNEKGALEASSVNYSGSMVFENTFTPEPVYAGFEGEKVLEGRDLAAGEFEFTIEAITENAPMPAITKVTNGVGEDVKKISFGTALYLDADTYEYKITETKGDLPSVGYDGGYVKATVNVKYDSKTGILTPEVSYEKVGGNGGEGFVFKNIYKADPTDPVEIEAGKAVNPTAGNSFVMSGDDFEFEVEPSQNNPSSDPIKQGYKTNAANGEIIFANAKYEEAGTYVYTVHEVDGNAAGIHYDDSVYVITVVVTDNTKAGKLEAEVTITKDNKRVNAIEFVNGYTPEEATAVIHGHKVLEGGHKDIEAGEFKFNIKALTANAPMPAVTTVTNEVTGLFQFGTITYTTPGTYEYEISEVNEGKAGYTYDSKTYKATVEVTDKNGVLQANVSGVKTAANEPIIVFTNTYDPTNVSTVFEAVKKLEGRDLKAGEFEFAVLDSEGKEVASAKNKADGTVTFEEIEFTKTGTYNFTLVEKDVKVAGVTNNVDNVIYGVQVVVTDEAYGGALDATVTYVKDGKEIDKGDVVFTNRYKAASTAVQFGAAKVLEGRDLEDGEFEFQLKAVGNAPMPENTTAVNTEDGTVLFDEIVYTEPGTYEYKISEVAGELDSIVYDNNVYKVTVTVTDDLGGNLVAEVEGFEDLVFTNIYKKPELAIVKTQSVNDGNATKENIAVEAGDKVTYYITVTNSGTGKATNIVIKDEITEGLKVIKRSISDGGKLKDGVITWNISELAEADKDGNPGTVTVSFTVEIPEVDEDTVWENVATVDSEDDNEEPETSNEVEAAEEPVVDGDGSTKTGDEARVITYLFALLASLIAAFVALIVRRRNYARR